MSSKRLYQRSNFFAYFHVCLPQLQVCHFPLFIQESGGHCHVIDNPLCAQKEQEEAEAAAAAAAQAEKEREEEALDNWEEMDVEAVKLPGTQSAEEEVCQALSWQMK